MVGRYLDLKWPVTPLLPGEVRPPFPWRQFCERPPGREEWRRWEVLFPVPPHGLGLLAGRPSGIVVLDIDDPRVAERLHTKIHFTTPFTKTRRGFHFYFSAGQEEIPTTVLDLPGIGLVEVKGTGSLVPLPPTQHRKDPNFRYTWLLAPWDVSEIPPLPKFVLDAIREKQRLKELARAVGTVKFPKPGRKLTREALGEILAEVGAEAVKEISLGDRTAWRLKACPLCGKSKGNPWVMTDTGRLFDFRTTCPAAKEQGGLPLAAWLRELGREDLVENLEVEEGEEAPPHEVPAASVREARSLILEVLRGGGDLIVTVLPGVGKSRTTLEWLCREGPRPVVWSVPTLRLARELGEEARALTAEPVVVFEGRNARTCLKWEEVKRAHDLGYDSGEIICPTCPHNPKNAAFSEKCEFLRQFEGINRERGLFFASHKLACHLIKDFLRKAKCWILDEEPHGLVEVVSCPLDGLRTLRAIFREDSATMRLAEAVLKLGDELHRATNGKKLLEGRIYARPVEFGPWAGKKNLAEWLDLDLTELGPVIRDEITQVFKTYRKPALFRKGINLNAFRWLEEVVGQGQAYLVARKNPARPIELRRVVNPVPDKWRGRLVVLDATACSRVVERALKRPGMQILDIRVPLEVRTAWLRRSVSKTAVSQQKGQKTAIKALKEALKAIKAEKILVFCHQTIKSKVEKAVDQDGRRIVVSHHFGTDSRGTNEFESYDAVILLGLPVPSPGAFYDVALALGLSAEEWTDWLDLLARAEAWQEAHRIRPVRFSGKKVLVIAPRWPFQPWLGGPREVIEPQEVRGAQDLSTIILELWVAVFYFVWREIALLLGIGRKEEIPPLEVRAELWRRIEQAYPEKVRAFWEQVEILLKGIGNPFASPETSQEVPRNREAKGFLPPYKRSLKGTGNPLPQGQMGNSGNPKGVPPPYKEIFFSGRKWWPKLLARLRKAHPDLPLFEVQIRTPGGLQRTRGLGDIEAAQEFCWAIGLEINEDAWRVCDV